MNNCNALSGAHACLSMCDASFVNQREQCVGRAGTVPDYSQSETTKSKRLYWHFLKTVKTVSQGNLFPVCESRCLRLLRTTQVK
jgi:hypothetical protein